MKKLNKKQIEVLKTLNTHDWIHLPMMKSPWNRNYEYRFDQIFEVLEIRYHGRDWHETEWLKPGRVKQHKGQIGDVWPDIVACGKENGINLEEYIP